MVSSGNEFILMKRFEQKPMPLKFRYNSARFRVTCQVDKIHLWACSNAHQKIYVYC